MSVEALRRAIKIAGSQTALAKLCGVKQQHVHNWLHRNKRVSARYVLQVEAATRGLVTRHELRPDLYPEETRISPISS
jgi:DNA-binding transcriptional regulator YdaS (Cro superfamily)